ncbi:MAG: CAP domain-containing protein [Propionibacteriales bacterium]|nr:CAP domain-containing protein [Propionibacteriales bacterium]
MALVGGSLVLPTPASAANARESRLIARINTARINHDLPPLRPRARLIDYAHQHARAMAAAQYLFHTVNFEVVCCWSRIAENVGYDATVRRVHRAFMASAAHRANILTPGMRGVGVGIVKRDGRLWVTEVFRRPT